jgi:hypothetical protein|nr:MAG TPA: hypothetical protein [Caudoviricetes sp.]
MINKSILITMLSPQYENKEGIIKTTGTATDGSERKKDIRIRWSRGKAGSSLVFWDPDMDQDVIDSRVAAQRASWELKKVSIRGTEKEKAMAILEAKEAMLNLGSALLLAGVDEYNARQVAVTLFAAWLAHHMFGTDAAGEE